MKIKINPAKLAARFKEKQEKAASDYRDPSKSIILKVDGPGKYNFRATYYPHGEDPSVEPFVERFYHYGFPGGPCYCPAKNEDKDCHICDFVWDRLKATKGSPAAKEWSKKLPQMCMFIPGLVRGREDEGCKFFRVSTREDKPSPNYTKIYEWFSEEDLCDWLDSDDGFDMQLAYAKPDAKQAEYLKGVKVLLSGVELARKSTKFGTKKEFEDFLGKIPNIDEEVFPRKSPEETLVILTKFSEILTKKAARSGLTAPSINLNRSEGTSTAEVATPAPTPTEKVEASAPAPVDDPTALDDKLTDLGL